MAGSMILKHIEYLQSESEPDKVAGSMDLLY